ncbi:MAG: 30S ribosomal protein S5 [Candidatus Moeniiplasma glomeromycotorum]|nr:30S ribosomal protein S5 [Candidatus Moeniiplasma glomeromycotorum]MCE8168229.1 30S ribosomal protein S5 [Candidatus Moeniiplasma glomeromycotorum]MCE8169762.1 30S ribosomal protein S5 [Candidatus Moeniiplasma glomeromycotorum]
MEKEKINLTPSSFAPGSKPVGGSERSPRKFSSFTKRASSPFLQLERVILETKRITKVTAGGRRFSFASPGLIKDKNKKLVTFAYTKGKEVPTTFQKMFKKAQKSFAHFSGKTPTWQVFPSSLSTIPHDIQFNYKTITILIKPAPPGSGVRAGGVLRKLFKTIGIKDVSAKIIGSGSNLNVTRAAFLALSKINWNKK